MKRVVCLYRVSTTGQVDKNDIPLQRLECHEFAKRMGDWEIIDELSEKGVSGFKVSAAKRDKITQLKEAALKKSFDILLVFMFDRLGRRDDETPFVAQWLIEHGIEIWSTQEGQMRLESHTDKLINYIRFWQAMGESEKTSVRVKTRQQQITAQGIWRGGPIPFGYKGVHNGRVGKKNRMLYDLEIDPASAQVVRLIFDLYCNKGMGTHRIAEYLNEHYPEPTRIWVPTTITTMLRNETYTGRLKCGEIRSPVNKALQIVDDDEYTFAQTIMNNRVTRMVRNQSDWDGQGKIKRYGATLLCGLLYCAHCGHRLVGTYINQSKKGQKPRYRQIYRCYNGSVSAKGCDGQSTYSAHKIEQAVLAIIDQYIARIRPTIDKVYRKTLAEHRRIEQRQQRAEQHAQFKDLEQKKARMKEEIVNAVMGTSSFDPQTLKETLQSIEAQIERTKHELDSDAALHLSLQQLETINHLKPILIKWDTAFTQCTTDEKKMLMARLINKITVDKNYRITIDFRVSFDEFYGNDTQTLPDQALLEQGSFSSQR